MSSRGSVVRRQNKSVMNRKGHINMGTSKEAKALMVKIDWTSAKVVRVEINKDFQMQAQTVLVLHGEYTSLAEVSLNVKAGQVFYFVQSDGCPGLYYVLQYSEQYACFNCSCPAGRIRHKCNHQHNAMVYAGHRYTLRLELEKRIDQDLEVHIDEELRMAQLEREFENLSSSAA